ncbi:hypothetical protein DP107_09015 [Haloglomus irregulare]|uniref:Uncharacterized protein n=1 Tax=Haloglomus irregulare TaxID=2234134 RepID=A0A554NAI4_9EURY|nr:hypothetical protein DP107_09015 [Haloglomus irregulare]
MVARPEAIRRRRRRGRRPQPRPRRPPPQRRRPLRRRRPPLRRPTPPPPTGALRPGPQGVNGRAWTRRPRPTPR